MIIKTGKPDPLIKRWEKGKYRRPHKLVAEK